MLYLVSSILHSYEHSQALCFMGTGCSYSGVFKGFTYTCIVQVDILFFMFVSQWLSVMFNVSRCSKCDRIVFLCFYGLHVHISYRYFRMTSTVTVRIRITIFAHHIRSLPYS